MNLETYLIQHKSIIEEMSILKSLSNQPNLDEHVAEITSHINTLAGKINVHLTMEDKHMYPNLLNSSDNTIRHMAERYQNEMGDIASIFGDFKVKYNRKQIFLNNKASFKTDLNKILSGIEKRISKEESELYKHIS